MRHALLSRDLAGRPKENTMRYRCIVMRPDRADIRSPKLRTTAEAWSFALGVAEAAGEHMHLLREIEGYIDERGSLTQISGEHGIYAVRFTTT